MRLFVAIELSDAVKDALIEAQNRMFDRGVRGSFTPEENLHLTLAFIGEYPDALPVVDALSAVSCSAFELAPDGLGCFGDLWWAGLRASPALDALAQRVRYALAEQGIPFDRKRFSPHITLLRRAKGVMPPLHLTPAAMTVEAFTLMRSDRGKNGMIYTPLARFPAEERFIN